MKVADFPSTKPDPPAITDVITKDKIEVRVASYRENAFIKELAGRTLVAIQIFGEEDLEPNTSIDLTVEDSIRLALDLIGQAAYAINLDPRPWRIDPADWYAVEAAQSARKHHRARAATAPEAETS